MDLIYLDPPFNSNRSYNVLFKEANGTAADAQIEAFDDTWSWGPTAEATYRELITEADPAVARIVETLVEALGRKNDMTAYLVMMTIRLLELRRVLKPTGSIYLHCDPAASHYLKVVMDAIFGAQNYRNEIIWKRQSAHSDATTKFADVADIILFYSASDQAHFEPQYGDYDPDYVAKFYRFDDQDGRGPYRLGDMASPNPRPNMMYEWKGYPCPVKGWRYQRDTMAQLDREGRIYYPTRADGTPDHTRRLALKRYLREQKGSIVTNVWTDINPLHSSSAERLGYPTQKPLELLERIIQASSNEGDLVLDPFCGCGTTVCAAERLGRRWIGIDITHLAIAAMESRLAGSFPEGVEYEVIGVPVDTKSARALAEQDRFQFEAWALSLIKAMPVNDGKRGGDQGIDGEKPFIDEAKGKRKRAIIQVKSGHVNPSVVRDLRGVVTREKAALGFLITLEPPTSGMQTETLKAGYYESPGWGREYQKLQIRTIEQLLAGVRFDMPPARPPMPEAEPVAKESNQKKLL